MALTPWGIFDRMYGDFLMPSRLPAYRATLESTLRAGYQIVSVGRFWRLLRDGDVDPTQRYLILRHDIDTDPRTGAAMWAIDQALGVQSSYFFRLSTLDIDLMRAIDRGGGEASYHYEELATLAKRQQTRQREDALRSIPAAQAEFRRNLERLRARSGLPMTVVASHGDFANRALRLPNWAILMDIQFRLEVGVELEAYDDAFMQRVSSRHSDAEYPRRWNPDDPTAAISRGSPAVYVLVHPRHWNVNLVANARDDVMRVQEGLRYRFMFARSRRTPARPHGRPPGAWAVRQSASEGSPILQGPSPALPAAQAARTPTGGDQARLFVRAPATYGAERRYVLDVVLSDWLGLEYDLALEDGPRVSIQLAGDSNGRELTLPDVLFATPSADWLTERSMPARPLARLNAGARPSPNPHGPGGAWSGGHLPVVMPVVFGEVGARDDAIEETPTGLALAIDVFGSVFFMLTRYEEIARRVRDEHERFPGFASLAAAEEFLERPLADEYVDLLWRAIKALWPTLERRSSAFRLRLTHDVDQPWAALGQGPSAVGHAIAGDLLRRRDPALAIRRARALLAARTGRVDSDPFDTFDLLMETSEQFGLKSTFYFQAGRTGTRFDGIYRLSDPPIARLLRRIHVRGHEIGLHGGYGSWRSTELIRAEFEALKTACRAGDSDQATWGVRQHYLRFENPETWRSQELAGFEHDSTVGFADNIGFRAGTCREYRVFDLLDRRPMNLRERPLVIMDATLFGYMSLNLDEAAARARAIVSDCRRHGGDAVLCYHNSSLAGSRERAHYRELIEALARP